MYLLGQYVAICVGNSCIVISSLLQFSNYFDGDK